MNTFGVVVALVGGIGTVLGVLIRYVIRPLGRVVDKLDVWLDRVNDALDDVADWPPLIVDFEARFRRIETHLELAAWTRRDHLGESTLRGRHERVTSEP